MANDLENMSDDELRAIVNGGKSAQPQDYSDLDKMSDDELRAIVSGGEQSTLDKAKKTAFEETPKQSSIESVNKDAKDEALGFVTGFGRGALFGQDIPSAVATALSYTPIHPKYVPTEGTAAERFEAAKRAQIEAANIAAERAPKSSALGTLAGVGASLPLLEFEAPLAGAVEAGTAARLAKLGQMGPKTKKVVDVASKGAGLGAAGATTGALYGLGEGATLEERLKNATSGAETGSAFNVGLPAVWSGLKKASGVTPLTEIEKKAVELGAPMPASVSSKNILTKFASEGLNVHPVAKSYMSEGVNTALQKLNEAKISKAGIKNIGEDFLAGESALNSIVDWIDKSSRDQINKSYNKFESMIAPYKKTTMSNTKAAINKIGNEKLNMDLVTKAGTPKFSEDLKELFTAVNNPHGLSYDSILNWKRRIGRKTSQVITSSDIDKEELDLLYGAVSKDVRKAAENAGGGLGTKKGKEALAAYDAANSEAKDIINQRKRFEKLVGDKGTAVKEDVFKKLSNAAKTGAGANKELLEEARKYMAPDAWHDVSSRITETMGMKGDNFVPSEFVKNYSSLSSGGKDALYGTVGNPMRKAMDDMYDIAKQYAKAKEDAHFSKLSLAGLTAIGLGVPFLGYGQDLLTSSVLGVGATIPLALLLSQPRLAHAFNGYMRNPNQATKGNLRKSLRNYIITKTGKRGVGMAAEDEREERASGGKVNKRDYPAKRLNKLERAALKAQREIALETKPIMQQPDEMVAKALEIAKGYE